MSRPAPPASTPTIRELGIPVKAVNWVRLHPGRGPDGKASLLASMGQNNGGLFVLDIDLATGHCRQFHAPSPAQQYPTASFRCPHTGALYVGSASDGHLLRYDPAHPERGLEDLGAIDGERATFPCGLNEAPDGSLWIGTYPDGVLTRFDPASGQFTRFGLMDDTDQYLYPLAGVDGTIAAMTKFTHPHLVTLHPQTGAHQSVGPWVRNPEDKSQHLVFFKGLDGLLYLETHAGNFRVRGMELEPVTYLPPQMPGIHATYKHGYQEVLPMPDGVVAGWADGEEGAGLFKRILLTSTTPGVAPRTLDLDWQGGGSNLFVIHHGPDGLLYGSSFLPEHLFRCAPDGSGMVNLGRCSVSLGEAYTLGNFSDGTMALASYPQSRISLYDPRQPYRYGTDATANPRDIGRLDEVGIRPVAMAIVPPLTKADGTPVPEMMWIGSLPDYGTWGGTLDWLDPKTGAHASHRHLVPDCAPFSMLWLPNLKQLLVGLCTEGGTGTRIKAKSGAFVLWDPAGDAPVYVGDFGRGHMASVYALSPTAGDRVYALVGYTRYASGTMGAVGDGRPRLMLLDPGVRKIICEAVLPGELGLTNEHSQFTIFPGPDGATYGITERVLYRVKAGTCETEIVWRAPEGDAINVSGPWIGRTFYFATGWRLRALTLS